MTQPSPDARAVVRALDALSTQARRIADALSTPVVQHVVTTDDDATTPARRPVVGIDPGTPPGMVVAQWTTEPPGAAEHRATVSGVLDKLVKPDGCEQHPTAGSVGSYCLACTIVPAPARPEPMDPAHLLGVGALATDGPEAACRVMETRTCPPTYNGPCGDRPCARFESDDPTPWLDTAPAAAPPADDADLAPNLLHVLVDRAARGVLTEGEAATFRRRVEQLVNGRATWKAKGEEMERDRDRLAAELTRSENARDHLRRRAEGAEAEAERLRDLVIAENKRADDAINREDTAESAAEEARTELAEEREMRERLGRDVVAWSGLARDHQQWGVRAWNSWQSARRRAQEKQAAIERVRRLCADPVHRHTIARADVLAALDGTEQPTTEA